MKETEKDKGKCTLSDAELIEKSNDWVSKLAKTGGKAWTLRVPVDFNYDPDMLFIEIGNRLKNYSEENEQLIEALRLLITDCQILLNRSNRLNKELFSLDKAKQLLKTDEP